MRMPEKPSYSASILFLGGYARNSSKICH